MEFPIGLKKNVATGLSRTLGSGLSPTGAGLKTQINKEARMEPEAPEAKSPTNKGATSPPMQSKDQPNTKEHVKFWMQQNDELIKMAEALTGKEAVARVPQITESSELYEILSDDGEYIIKVRYFRACNDKNDQPPPLIIHFHGGGQTLLEMDVAYELNVLADFRDAGVSALTVEFRNAREFPFPAGVDDCLCAVRWASENRDFLGTNGTIVACGFSGGGNLALGSFIRAIQRNEKHLIDGIYAEAPCLKGEYSYDNPEQAKFPKLLTNIEMMNMIVHNYTTSARDAKNPAAWPLNASDDMLTQFPPTMLVANEFDLLRLDAEEMWKRLQELNVPGCSHVMRYGEIHCNQVFPTITTKVEHLAWIRNITGFVEAVSIAKQA